MTNNESCNWVNLVQVTSVHSSSAVNTALDADVSQGTDRPILMSQMNVDCSLISCYLKKKIKKRIGFERKILNCNSLLYYFIMSRIMLILSVISIHNLFS